MLGAANIELHIPPPKTLTAALCHKRQGAIATAKPSILFPCTAGAVHT
jgi:hypothetical protein